MPKLTATDGVMSMCFSFFVSKAMTFCCGKWEGMYEFQGDTIFKAAFLDPAISL